ncbi:MAG: PaaI family thioesterase [Rhizobacter sp.]|nr:PaaI family thioesterase [Rhizobacter sp.]
MDDITRRVQDSFDSQGLMKTLGATLALAIDGEVHVHMPFSPALSQQHGYMHAGTISSILDTACGYAALTKAPLGFDVVTAEFKINLVRPALGHHFLAIGRVQTNGKLLTVATGEVRAYDEDGVTFKVVALMQATVVNVKR